MYRKRVYWVKKSMSICMALVAACGSFQICSADEEPPTNRLVFSKTFENIADNSWSNLEFPEDGQPPGLYYIELTELEGTVGCWGSQNNPYEDGPNGELLIAWRDGEPMLGNTDSDFRLQYRPTTSDWVELIAIAPQGAIGPSWTPFGLQDAEESIGQTFIALEEFTGVGLHTPTWNTNSSACTISLYAAEVQKAELAADPSPADAAADVPHEITLSWTPGEFAVKHTVYLSTDFADVNDGSASALIADNIDDATVDAGVLAFDQTYYWRVDELNAPPDNTIFKGEVWSFTVEPFVYAVEGVTATAFASDPGSGPENIVNGSGLNANDEHSTESVDMWSGTLTDNGPVWVQFEFDTVYKLHQMLVWNCNVQFEAILGFGLNAVTVEYSENGVEWTVLGDLEFAKATSMPDYTANTTVDFGGVAAKYVKVTATSNHGMLNQYGLSEVRFLYIPANARYPEPADAETEVVVESVLSWRAGREAASHEVYLGTAADALALVDTVATSSYAPTDLEFGTDYYWQIVEVNEAEAISAWASGTWTFQTQSYATIDDFESYDNEDNAIYNTWIDGWVNGTGSTAGYLTEPFAETSIVNSGRQSMPLMYDNSFSPSYSEVERDLGGLDLDAHGADTLRLFVAGQAPPYIEVDDSTIAMSAIGDDIWNAADAFRYAYVNLSGDGSILARVDGLYRSNEWVKGGVMIRESTEVGSAFAAVYLTGDYGVRYQARLETDASAVSDSDVVTDDQVAQVAPVWVKIERVGNTFNGYYSADGENWTAMAWNPQTMAMASDVTIGLALTSHDSSISTGAVFSGIATEGGVSGGWQTAEIGVAQPTDAGNSIEPLYVALEDSAGNVAIVTNPNPAAAGNPAWQEWLIPYSDLAGINLNNVSMMYIGVGDRDNPVSGGAGTIYVDDIGFGAAVTAP